jgi:AcrR family transcriptional regulator
MIQVVCEVGYPTATATAVCERAGVGMVEFRRVFASKEEAFTQVFEEEGSALLVRCQEIYAEEEDWTAALRAIGVELARWVRDDPLTAQFMLVESLAAGEAVQLRRDVFATAFAELVDRGRALIEDPGAVPSDAALAVVGAVIDILERGLSRPRPLDPEVLSRKVSELMYFAVRPYLGHDRAARELAIAVPI